MKRFSILTQALVQVLAQALVFTLIISACGSPQVTPTVNPVDLQSTISVLALTIVAETQAAIPTATPPPPTATLTNTPASTATLPVTPTLGVTFTALPAANSGGADDPCIHQVLPGSLEGYKIRIRIDNPTKAPLMLSVNLQQARPEGQCGYRIYSLAAGESLVINDLVEGCYTIWAWNPDPDEYFIVTNGTSCLDMFNSWTFDISTSSIRLRP
jgi:hypothetical protein